MIFPRRGHQNHEKGLNTGTSFPISYAQFTTSLRFRGSAGAAEHLPLILTKILPRRSPGGRFVFAAAKLPQTTYDLRLTTYYLRLTTYYLLLTTYYLLLATCYLLLATCCSLLTTYCLLLSTHYSLLTTRYSLITTHYSLLATH